MSKDGMGVEHDDFLHANQNLLEYLEDTIRPSIERAEEILLSRMKSFQNGLNDIVDYYRTNSDMLGLAEVQIGLPRYIDYALPEVIWSKFESGLTGHISLISILAQKIIRSHKTRLKPRRIFKGFKPTCGKHEDHACKIIKFALGFVSSADVKELGWVSLPAWCARTFLKDPQPIKLKKGDRLIRIVDCKTNIIGHWWMRAPLPSNITVWRSEQAVLQIWNSDSYYAEMVIDEDDLRVWSGKAASQKIPKEKCILFGGGDQIWMPLHIVKRLVRDKLLLNVPSKF